MNKYKCWINIILSILIGLFIFPSISQIENLVKAEYVSTAISGTMFEFNDKEDYILTNSEASIVIDETTQTYGNMLISGNLSEMSEVDGVPSFVVSEDDISFSYIYNDLESESNEEWYIVEEKSKVIDGIKLDSKILEGVLILQTSKDSVNWVNGLSVTNVFKENPMEEEFYKTTDVQLANGTYYRIIVAYRLARKVGEKEFLFIKSDEIEYKKVAEVYQFYLYDVKSEENEEADTHSITLGETINTGVNNGYSGKNMITIDNPHYGWKIGNFFLSGYTRETKVDNKLVLLKNVGDEITLWFKLEQDINKLNGKETLSIANDGEGYDQFFQTLPMNMGRGTLILRLTDHKGVKHEPEIYTNYLEANGITNASTVVNFFEEGDYEVALNYKLRHTPRTFFGIDIIPEYDDYRIAFEFSVRNGNTMVFPFDIITGEELADKAITPNGFRLDMAKSKYLKIDVTKSVLTESESGLVEDVRFNRPAQDGEQYVEEGIYTFDVSNLYTGQNTKKTIYVGESVYLQSLAEGFSVMDLNNETEENSLTITED